jgi:putative phage-type endonuclease
MKKYNMQQGSIEWSHVRKGKITGTTLKAIMGTPKARQEAIYEIIAERLSVGVSTDYENPMDRGTRLEPEAITVFEFETGIKTELIGFAEHDDNTHIGNSPDRMVKDDDTLAVEVKCPLGKNYVKLWLTNEVPDEYEHQVIQYFAVNEQLQKLYFVGYNPDIKIHPLHIIEVTRESLGDKVQIALEKQTDFLLEVDAILRTIVTL